MVCRTPEQDEIARSISKLIETSDGKYHPRAPFLRLVNTKPMRIPAMPLILDERPIRPRTKFRALAASKRCSTYLPKTKAMIQRARKRRLENMIFGATALLALSATISVGFHYLVSPVHPAQAASTITVAPGDTLWSLARRYETSNTSAAQVLSEIRSDNPSLSQGTPLTIGEKIVVPVN